jgi:hypothetical protein
MVIYSIEYDSTEGIVAVGVPKKKKKKKELRGNIKAPKIWLSEPPPKKEAPHYSGKSLFGVAREPLSRDGVLP